ncbi:MAG: hypothetical protein LC799_10730 [Actinobacteria bacterium]|nr:hypothetical protein [Actinomycetota bacterium]
MIIGYCEDHLRFGFGSYPDENEVVLGAPGSADAVVAHLRIGEVMPVAEEDPVATRILA